LTAQAGVVTVLVVDDEEPIRNALRKFLKQQQFEVYTAGSADEALQQLRLHKIALMLSDIRMPGTSGVDLVPHALEIEPDLAILMLTAVNDATSAALCMQRGAMDYLTKPIELVDLGRAVQRAVKPAAPHGADFHCHARGPRQRARGQGSLPARPLRARR
jgi:DNA-binding NtrC family response regulator